MATWKPDTVVADFPLSLDIAPLCAVLRPPDWIVRVEEVDDAKREFVKELGRELPGSIILF